MSYDLWLLPRNELGDDPAAAYDGLAEREDRDPTPAEEQQLRQLAADLRAANPDLDLTEPEAGFLLQLGYETERPVVIDIGVNEITMSWSYGADDAEPALAEVRRYLPVFERHGYVAYDPQLERLFDPDRDAADAADVHQHVQELLNEKYRTDRVERRPWWRRLLP